MWRPAQEPDDEVIVRLALRLADEDPGPQPVDPAQIHRTLEALRRDPVRGRAIVLDPLASGVLGYAFLIAFWSNELGGEICTLDEIYVAPEARGQGHTTRLVEALAKGSSLWPGIPVAIELEVRPENVRARTLYERLGFRAKTNTTMRRGSSA